jgi:ABC-type dipeptide/oligopeptide/nickel transport system ATPase subunit
MTHRCTTAARRCPAASGSGSRRRVLVGLPAVLLLDEATSELDTLTDEMVYRNLAAVRATTIVIARRLSTIRNADLIVVMDNGSIAEFGVHHQLLAAGGLYASLVRAQADMTGEQTPGGNRPGRIRRVPQEPGHQHERRRLAPAPLARRRRS